MDKKTIGILHGAINNAGDFLIKNRGFDLILNFLDQDTIELIPIERWKQIEKKCDVLIILGGPLIRSTLHPHAKNIYEYINKNEVPVICIGLGIGGDDRDGYNNFFKDEKSVFFWKKVYESSRLFSVRDKDTKLVLKEYGIDAYLTGCPAFFEMETIKKKKSHKKSKLDGKKEIKKMIVTIPNLNFKDVLNFSRTLYFISYLSLRAKIEESNINKTLVFQHKISSVANKICARYAQVIGFEVLDASGKGINEYETIREGDLHIGTRLHSNIYFLSTDKPSYLLSVDKRTRGFLSTISTPSEEFTMKGIKKLVDLCFEESKNTELFDKRISETSNQISSYYIMMVDFMNKVNELVEKTEHRTNV